MRNPRALVAVIGYAGSGVHELAHRACVLKRSEDGAPPRMCSPFHGTLSAMTSQGSATSARQFDE